MTDTTEKTIWQKTADELTVAENLKIAAGVTIITMAVPVVIFSTYGAIISISEKAKKVRTERKAKKNAELE